MSFSSKSNKNKRSESANTKDSLKKINISELLEQKEKENQTKFSGKKSNKPRDICLPSYIFPNIWSNG